MVKRIVDVTDVGFDEMLGESICVYCSVYIYAGKLVGVNDKYIELDNAKIVYDTGGLCEGDWSTAEKLPSLWRVMFNAIESWGKSKCE